MINVENLYNSKAIIEAQLILEDLEIKINGHINSNEYLSKNNITKVNDYIEAIEYSIHAKNDKEVYVFSKSTEQYSILLDKFLKGEDDEKEVEKKVSGRSLVIKPDITLSDKFENITFFLEEADDSYRIEAKYSPSKTINYIKLSYPDLDLIKPAKIDDWINRIKKEYNNGAFFWFYKEVNPLRRPEFSYAISVFFFLRCNRSYLLSESVNKMNLVKKGIEKLKNLNFTNYNNESPTFEIEERINKEIKLTDLSIPILHKFYSSNQLELTNQAKRAAISQVMSRNMSHNIGSHVMSKFNNVKKITEVIKQYVGQGIGNETKLYNNETELPLESISALNNVAVFNNFLKNRMDFLADIATSELSSLENPVLFFRQLMKGLVDNKILLNRISGLDTQDLKFKFKYIKNGIEIKNLQQNRALLRDDFYVSLPNDMLGCHAFYIIIENIIRNICKHSKSPKLFFKLCIEVSENPSFSNYYKLEIYPEFYSDHNFTVLKSNTKGEIDDLSKQRNDALNKSILNDNRLRDTGLGSIEMDVCAAYLRKRDVIIIDDDDTEIRSDNNYTNQKDNTPNFLYATTKQIKEKEKHQYNLCYTIHLRKPRQILILDDLNSISWENKEIIEIEKTGVWLFNKNKEYKPKNIYSHEIVVIIGDDLYYNNIIKNNKNNISARIVRIQCINELNGLPNTNNNQELVIYFWEKYIQSKDWSIRFTKDNTNYNTLLNYNLANNKKTIFLDDHEANYCANISNANLYYERMIHNSLSNSFKNIGNYNNQENIINLLMLKYIENVFTSIVVIDERIQSNVVDELLVEDFEKFNYYTYFLKQNLIIPTKSEADLNLPSFLEGIDGNKNTKESIITFIKKQKERDVKSFFIIHLGILEKLLEDPNDKSFTSIESLINEIGIEEERLIITSGRGKPDNLPYKNKFVPLASILNAIETIGDKFLLTQILYNARRYK